MNWSICWISRRAQEPQAPMISSISLRSPRKTCGLFDSGFAGGTFDATSLDLNAPAALLDDPFSLGSLNSVTFTTQPGTSASVSDSDAYQEEKQNFVQPNVVGDLDMLDPLADLETDQLADSSLDAFVNLEDFLMGDAFFDENIDMKTEAKPFEMKSDFADFLDESVEVMPVINMPMVSMTEDTDFFLPDEPVMPPTKSRKRKASKGVEVNTSMFEIPMSENVVSTTTPPADPQLDHDYTTKRQKMSATSGSNTTTSGNSSSKEKPAKVKVPLCEPSTSTNSSEEFNVDKQAVRRMKNNVASKRSREQRKQKFVDLDKEAEELIVANEELKKKIVELERVAKEMKALLVAKMAGK